MLDQSVDGRLAAHGETHSPTGRSVLLVVNAVDPERGVAEVRRLERETGLPVAAIVSPGAQLEAAALRGAPFMLKSMVKPDRVQIMTMARKVAEPDQVAACWKRILAWPCRTLLTYHDVAGSGFVGDGRAALTAAVERVHQLRRAVRRPAAPGDSVAGMIGERRHEWLVALGVLLASCGGKSSGGKGGSGGNGGAISARGGAGGVSDVGGSAGGVGGSAGVAGSGAAGTGGAGATGGAGTGGGSAGRGGAAGTTGVAGTSGSAGTTGGPGSGGSGGTTGRGGATAGAGGGGTSGAAGGGGGGSVGTGGTGNCTTSVSGTVYDPAGTLPLYNVMVYAPTTPLTAITEGVTCDRCAAPSGAPSAVATSDARGKFKLEGLSAGTNVRLVFQIGKWRREVMVPSVAACADTAITDANLTRLPRDHTEGHIPRIALTTGGAESLECFVRRIGVADSEFTTDAGGGRVHLYAGGGGATSLDAGGSLSAATTLWSSPAKLAGYDMVGFSCEGSTSDYVADKPQESIDNVTAYANNGGRLLFTHLHLYWLQRSANFSGTATYIGNLTNPPSPLAAVVSQTTAPGMAFAQWLASPGVNASTTLGQLSLVGAQHSVTAVTPPTTEWVYLTQNPSDTDHRRAVELLGFQTPVTMPAAQQCGKVAYSDLHIKDSDGSAGGDRSGPSYPFPTGCKNNTMTAQMKALEFIFFDLGACL